MTISLKEYYLEVTNNFWRNTLKSVIILLTGSILFVSIITLFPLIGSLTMDNFPIEQVIKNNFGLLIPLSIVCILIAPLFGLATCRLKKKRLFYLFIIGIGSCLIAIVSVMFMWSNFVIVNDIGFLMVLSIWALLAYSIFSLPILIPAIFIIEKWTRKAI